MKAKRFLAILLTLAMVFSLVPAFAVSADSGITFWDIRNEENVTKREMTVYVDSVPINVTHYQGHYYNENEENQIVFGIPESLPAPQGLRDDLQINIYVPEGATEDSAVLFILENGSWASNGFPTDTLVDGKAYTTSFEGYDVTTIAERAPDFAARAANVLARNMILVSYGCRSRGQVSAVECASTDEGAVQLGETGKYYKPGTEYVAHTPKTVTDTKAAIRFLKYNLELGTIPGNENRIFIVGHSGGGALATIIGATGNSSDYDEYLVNAAPSTDDVFGVLASAPITDLPMADFGYEFAYGEYREFGAYAPEGEDRLNANGYLSYGMPDAETMELSAKLAQGYAEYIEKMFGLSADEFKAEIKALLEDSVRHEIGLEPLFQFIGVDGVTPDNDTRGWFELDADGNLVEGSFDMDAYYKWMINHVNLGPDAVHTGNEVKGVIAFMGQGMTGGYSRNENNLWGSTVQQYGIAYEYLWDRVADKAHIGVDKYESWDEFWAAEGEMTAMQMKMTSPMPYLMGSGAMWYLEGLDNSGDESDVAPNWFTRLGMCDADTSTAVYTALVLGVKEAAAGETNCYFGWERDHNMGAHYLDEFFAWMDDVLAKNDPKVCSTLQAITVDGHEVEAEVYNINGSNYFKLRDMAALMNGTGSQFSVAYDEAADLVTVVTGEAYTAVGGDLVTGADKSASCVLSAQTVVIDGHETGMCVYNIGGNNFFKLRDLGEALGFDVSYDEASNTAVILSRPQYGTTEGGTAYVLYSNTPYVESPNDHQYLDVYYPDGESPEGGWPVYFYVHGGGFTTGDKTEAGSSLNAALTALDHGYAVVAVNYSVNGEKTQEQITKEIVDVKAAIRYVKANAEELGLNKEITVLTGPSAGGGLVEIVGASWNSADFDAALKAIGAADADDRVTAVVAYAGAGDLDNVGDESFIASHYFDKDDPAFLIAHGDADPVVSCEVSKLLASAAEEAGINVKLVLVEGAMHTFQNFFTLYDVADTFAWLDAVIK